MKNIMLVIFRHIKNSLTAFWLEYINNTVKSKEDIEEIIGLPVIGLIPVEK